MTVQGVSLINPISNPLFLNKPMLYIYKIYAEMKFKMQIFANILQTVFSMIGFQRVWAFEALTVSPVSPELFHRSFSITKYHVKYLLGNLCII